MTAGADGATSALKGRLYLLAMLIDTIGSGMWMPIGLIFFTRAQHLPIEQVGVALTVGGVFGLAAGPVSGNLVDRFGPAPFVVISNVARGAVFFVYPLIDSAWQVSLLAAVYAAADRLFWTANTPLLGSLVAGRRLDRLLATQNVIRIVGLGLGAAACGLLAGTVPGLHLLADVNAISYLLAACVIFFAVEMSKPAAVATAGGHDDAQRPGWRATLADRPYLALCLIQLLFALSALSLVVILPLAALVRLGGPSWLPGASIVVGNTVLALAQKPAVKISEKMSRARGLILAGLIFALTFLLMAPATEFDRRMVAPLVLIVSMLGVVGEALSAPLMTAAANQAAPQALRGRYSALFQTSWGLATVLAPALFTGLLAAGNAVLWLTLCCIALMTIPGLLAVSGRLPDGCLQEGSAAAPRSADRARKSARRRDSGLLGVVSPSWSGQRNGKGGK